MKYLTLIFLCAILVLPANTQPCRDFHEKACAKMKKGFKVYGQSRSGLLEIDRKATLNVVFYGEKDYVISLCTEGPFYPIRLKLINSKTNELLYDNIYDDHYESIGFTIEKTMLCRIEVVILAEDFEPKDFEENRACTGIHIQWRKTPKTGFR